MSEIRVDTINEKTSGSGVTIDGLIIKDGNISGDVSLAGVTPTFTIGDAGAEDATLVFDGNAQDFYIALDDSADDLIIGLGSTVGTTPMLSFTEAKAASFAGAVTMASTLGVTGIVSGAGFTAGSAVLAEAELELLDGLTAGTAIASKVVTTDANIDTTGQRNLTISGEIDAATGDFSGAVDVAGATTTAAITASGIIKTDDTTAATSTTDGSLQTDGGLSVALDAVVGDDLYLKSDAAVIHFGADSDTTLTHSADEGLTLDSGSHAYMTINGDASNKAAWVQLAQGGTNRWLIGCDASETDYQWYDRAGSAVRMRLSQAGTLTHYGAAVFNESSADVDFRVESNGNANMIFVDGGSDHVNIGTASDLGGVLNVEGLLVTNGGAVFNEGSADVDFRIEGNGNANLFVLDAGADAVLVGTATHDGNATFSVESAGNAYRPCYIYNGGEVATTTYGTRFKMLVTRDDNTSDLMIAGDNTADRWRVLSDGDVVNHDNSYGAISDQRIKQNIRDSNSQWDDIKAVKVRNYKRKDDVRYYGADAWEQIGVIAQELEASGMDKLIKHSEPSSSDILSDAAFGTLYEDGDVIPAGKQIGDVKTITANVKKVAYSILYMKAIKALQEAQTRIETLETKVTALEG